ncbi:MAG TPA: xanthine dehydrogenase family protein molybdopterin-binding subunit [candidate division Zixibacteria bacterium]|nr:xanthine dehydrogenase family protein molybdopterin-binding subunit [candidate division Zixibacteria bacterium]
MPFSTIGKPLPRIEGEGKVTGKTQYAADLRLDGLLWAKVLRSPFPHARIASIDVSRARRLPGVRAVLTGADVAGIYVGTRVKDQPVLAGDRTRFVGDPVAAVAAESEEIAEQALELIDVIYEELPWVCDPLAALSPDAPLIHEDRARYKNAPPVPEGVPTHNLQSYVQWKNGDLEAAFRKAARVFTHTFRTPLSFHGYIEPHACVVQVHADGRVEVWASNKGPWGLRDQMAADFGIPKEKIKVHVMHVGGDFGAKASLIDVPICYHLAKAAGRPVKLVLEYSEEILAGGHRHPAVIELRTGVESDGSLAAIDARVYFSGGAYAAQKANPQVTVLGGRRLASMYRVPAIRVQTYCAYTNHVPCTQTRTPGSPQIVFAFESQMDIIARELGIDPVELRRRNLLRDGDSSPMGERWQHILAGETLERAVRASGWTRRKRGKNRGWGVALYERGAPEGKASAAITLEADGGVTILTGVPDVGPGFYTIIQQMVCETLGLAPGRVRVTFEDTDSLPFDPGTGGSKQTNTSGHAVYQAAREVRERLAAIAARLLGCASEQVTQRGAKFVGPGGRAVGVEAAIARAVEENGGPVSHLTMYEPKDLPKVTGFTAQVAEVEVDPETGHVRVLGLTTAHDTGVVLNRLTLQGQIDGGVVTGLGFALVEENPLGDGRIATANLGECKLPTIRDTPPLRTVLIETPTGPTPFGGKAIAENPNVPTAAAIANAVADAVGVRIFELPITAERVYRGLHAES